MTTMAVSHPCWRAATAVKKRIPHHQPSDFFTWMTSFEHYLSSNQPLSSSDPRRYLSSKTPRSTENTDADKHDLQRHNSNAREASKQEILRYGPWPVPLHQQQNQHDNQNQTKQPLTPVSRFKSSSRRGYKQNHSSSSSSSGISSSSSSSSSSSRRKQQQGINNVYHDFNTSLVKASDYVYRRLPHSTVTETNNANSGPTLSSASSASSNSGHSWDASRSGVTSTRRRGETTKSEDSLSTSSDIGTTISTTSNRLKVLPSIDASALLNPKKYCRDTAKFSHTHNVHRTIHGTEAARRLLRGKKDFIVTARKLTNGGSTPMLLEGHGVPQPLFQHCIDLADALLLHYGQDVVECSFRNYHNSGSSSGSSTNNTDDDTTLPPYFRVLKRNALKATLESKPYYCRFQYDEPGEERDLEDLDDDVDVIEWDHHLKLYLTVMERLATGLGLVLEVSKPQRRGNEDHTGSTGIDRSDGTTRNKPPPIDEFDYFHDDDDDDAKDDVDDSDFTSSPLLFPLRPYWNVTIVRNAHFDLQPNRRIHNHSSMDTGRHNDVGWDDNNSNNSAKFSNDDRRRDGRADHVPLPPFPIVEIIQERSKAKGHIVISLQGCAVPNVEFSDTRRRQSMKPVTLLFDACFRKPTVRFSQE